MDSIKDKVNQGLIRMTYARNEILFCESILKEKDYYDKLQDNNDFSPTFYSKNPNVLNNLFHINLRMAITDLYTVIVESEKNSFIKINNTLKYNPKLNDKIEEYDKLIEYLCLFDKEVIKYNEICDSLKTIRNIYVAHTDGINRRVKFKDVSVNVYKLKELMQFLFSYYLNVDSFIQNVFDGNLNSLFTSDSIKDGSSNTFEKMSLYYKKTLNIQTK